MNMDQLEGKWEQLKGQAKAKWGKLTDNDILEIKGKRQELVGKIQERYGYAAEKAGKEVDRFLSDCDCGSDSPSSKKEKTIRPHA